MFTRKFWHVLIVDDEPDIHEVTKLTLKKEEFFGVKLKLHHANSAKEAIAMMSDPVLARSIAVALVDVVMETDHAGLDFCRFVREDLHRRSLQLVLRTGQPGQAPPRKIIDDLSITNYLTKMEATGDRLYMTIKAGIQQFYETTITENWAQVLESLRAAANTQEGLLTALQKFLAQEMGQGQELNVALDFFGRSYAGGGSFKDKSAYDAVKADLLKRGEAQLSTTSNPAFYSESTANVPNRVAKVDNYVIVQTSAIGTTELATMVLQDPSYPRDHLSYYGPIWRLPLAWLAQAMVPR